MSDKESFSTYLLSAATDTTAGAATSFSSTAKTVQAAGSTTSGTGSATIAIEGTNNTDWPWLPIGVISLTLGTTATSDGLIINADWTYIRARVVSISGTGASVSVMVGV